MSETTRSKRVNDLLRTIGLRVAELRRARGLTQAELAALIPMHVAQLKHIEQGRLNLTMTTIDRVAEYFDVPTGDLFKAPRTKVAKRRRAS
jgi:transcriptional regulator with XRE-family HTH domain